MLLRRFYDDALAQASYLIGCQATGEALVVDPTRDAEQYVRAAAAEGVRVTQVTETHIHADFVSGSRELAARTGVQPPAYSVSSTGPDHDRKFTAVVVVGDVSAEGLGTSKKQAEMAAALSAWQELTARA